MARPMPPHARRNIFIMMSNWGLRTKAEQNQTALYMASLKIKNKNKKYK